MGVLTIIKNVDFSGVNVGKIDIPNEIFKRKAGGKLERNKLITAVGTAYTTAPISMPGDTAELRFNFYELVNLGNYSVFGVADYAGNKGLMIYLNLASNVESFIQIYVLSDGGSPTSQIIRESKISLGNLGTLNPTQSHSLVANINFTTNKVTSATIDNVTVTPTYQDPVTQTRFTHKTASLAFGVAPWLADVPALSVTSAVNLMQLKDASGNIVVLFDFVGDNELEILTEKQRLITLTNNGAEIIPDYIV